MSPVSEYLSLPAAAPVAAAGPGRSANAHKHGVVLYGSIRPLNAKTRPVRVPLDVGTSANNGIALNALRPAISEVHTRSTSWPAAADTPSPLALLVCSDSAGVACTCMSSR